MRAGSAGYHLLTESDWRQGSVSPGIVFSSYSPDTVHLAISTSLKRNSMSLPYPSGKSIVPVQIPLSSRFLQAFLPTSSV